MALTRIQLDAWRSFLRGQAGSLNSAYQWLPSQNGLFFDCPQRHRVWRARTS